MKAIPVQACFRSIGFQNFESQISRRSAHGDGKAVSFTHQLPLPPRKYSWYSLLGKSSVARKIMTVKNSRDTIGN